jgi:cytochrome P450
MRRHSPYLPGIGKVSRSSPEERADVLAGVRRAGRMTARHSSHSTSRRPKRAADRADAALAAASDLLLEFSRRRFGDTFRVRFVGFQQPLVMLWDPEAIRALYGNPEHGLPVGRTVALLPILGQRSLLLLEGRDRLARRRLMLAPFYGARTRAYESTVRDVVARDVVSLPKREPFAMHAHMQRVTLEVIRRAVFGVTDPDRRERLADQLGRLLAQTASVGLQFAGLLSRRFGAPDPLCASAERGARRNPTFSPAGGTRVIAVARHPPTAPGYDGETAPGAERLSA